MKSLIKNLLHEALESDSEKGKRYFEMLKTAKFQHYDDPKGQLSTFNKGEEDRKRLVSKLSKKDKEAYKEWLKTPEGEASLKRFEEYCTTPNVGGKASVNEAKFIIDKYGDKVKTNKGWGGLDIPISEFKTKVKDNLVNILMEERKVSEKSFKAVDEIIKEVGEFFNKEPKANTHLKETSCRPQYIAEKIYDEYMAKKD